jgi:ATP-dependent exoDNAse (exonuclease V) alpha subunit
MVVGDFYQLPPITKQNSNSLFKDEIFAFESSAWGRFNFKSVILEEVKRTSDKEFIKILSKIRKGICDKDVKKYLSNLRDNKIVDEIEPTYLFARNLEVESMNMQKLSKLQTQEALFFWDIEKLKDIDDRKISSWSKALPVVERLHLKIGAPIIFTVNKWGAFVNGQRGVVVGFNDDSIIVRSKGKDIKVSEHDFELLELDSNTLEPKAVATLSQFPIKLAYAITIHKSQGMSLESLICNLDYLFAPSQLYVAISRAVEPKLLSIEYSRSDFNSYLSRAIRPNEIVDNFYEELENEN